MAVVQLRHGFTTRYRHLKRQRQWLIELERRLDPPLQDGQPNPTRRHIQKEVQAFLDELAQHAMRHPPDARVVAHIQATFAQRWSRLFACYAWPERYRTNNELETFFNRLRTRQRQINGRKSTQDFILRYGEWAVFIDPRESLVQVLQRIHQFQPVEFDQEYARFRQTQQRFQVLYRFRHEPRRCLKELEQQWAAAIRRQPR